MDIGNVKMEKFKQDLSQIYKVKETKMTDDYIIEAYQRGVAWFLGVSTSISSKHGTAFVDEAINADKQRFGKWLEINDEVDRIYMSGNVKYKKIIDEIINQFKK